MNGFEVILTLTEDCIFSDRAAMVGGHDGLNYIPGATLLGAAAAKLYPQLSSADAFTLFHSGQVRFGNGLPVGANDEPTWPMPLCWHHGKGEKFTQEAADQRSPDGKILQLLANKVWRLGEGVELPNHQQPKQLRESYVSQSGYLAKPNKAMRMKTAIDPKTGIAREAALFGYESLNAGQRFVARISADATVAKNLLDTLKKVFSETVLLGRSRSAEYGRVTTQVRDLLPIPNDTSINNNRLTLWLLSDLAAIDPHGQPTLAPLPQWLGLPNGKMVLGETFLRTRRYSPWNAHRGAPDLERQVIGQGSVLVFTLDDPLTAEHKAHIATGLGAYREAGLGQVWLNPDWLGTTGDHPNFVASKSVTRTKLESEPASTTLTIWLEHGNTSQETRGKHARDARKLAKAYQEILASARRLKGLDKTIEIGPSASQWGSVLGAAKTANDSQDLGRKLFDGNSCVCKPSMAGWKDEYWSETGDLRSFVYWLQEDIFKHHPDTRFMQILAREIMFEVKS